MKITKAKILCLLIAAAVITATCLLPRFSEKPAPKAQTVYTVRTEKAVPTDLQEYMLMNGSVRTENTIAVYPDVAGKLVEVPVTLGSFVRKRQLIARVDQSTPGNTFNTNAVYAPISGYITSLPLTVGTTVTQSTEIAHIGNITNLQIEAKIPESKIAAVKNGLEAEVSLAAYKGETFRAHVLRTSPIVDETSRTEDVYFVFDESDERIRAGMYVRIKLNTVLHKDTLCVPVDAIVSEDGADYAFVLSDDGTAMRRRIEKGVVVDGRAQVLSGISAGERVITEGMQVLTDGVKANDIGGAK